MGCEQSSERKSTSEQSRWSSRVLSDKIQVGPKENGTTMIKPVMDTQVAEKLRELVASYQRKEEKINLIEKGEPLTMFYIKKSHLDNITKKIIQQEKKVAELEHSDFKSVKNVLAKFGNKKLDREDHEMLANSNKLEIALTELEMAHQEKALVENKVRNLHSTLLNLRETYKQQDELLGKLSVNNETPEETGIQAELADIESRRMKLSEIYERWKEGRMQVLESCRHFSTALKKWTNLPADSLEKYETGEDIRDDLVNAIQCLTNAKFYLHVELPYCSPAEISVLEKAMTYLFIDLRSDGRRKHAELCYSAIHKRAVALFAWIDKTIELVIEPDLRSLTRVINDKLNSLKLIRADEIRKKYPEIGINDNYSGGEEMIMRLSDLDMQSNLTSLDSETEKTLHELQFDQLAPLPSLDEISVASTNTEDLFATMKTELGNGSSSDVEKRGLACQRQQKHPLPPELNRLLIKHLSCQTENSSLPIPCRQC
ncbi:unnamed protein product [Allacma fusca]|uniref:Uncharacterized protein n=1 Tax=Allacma fusca TaxID=39272 RepID=A0A8J2JXA4_9HEXA|nr:unnamed protein product [Allacma fusca]